MKKKKTTQSKQAGTLVKNNLGLMSVATILRRIFKFFSIGRARSQKEKTHRPGYVMGYVDPC